MTQTEPDSPWQNRTKVEIRELKKHTRCLMSRTVTPLVLWDYCCQYAAELRNRIARPLLQLKGRTPYELLTGNMLDISEFTWHQPIWYYKPSMYPEHMRHIGCWISVAHRVG
jgi:hypothetical protein